MKGWCSGGAAEPSTPSLAMQQATKWKTGNRLPSDDQQWHCRFTGSKICPRSAKPFHSTEIARGGKSGKLEGSERRFLRAGAHEVYVG
jgi:hypothetical protein